MSWTNITKGTGIYSVYLNAIQRETAKTLHSQAVVAYRWDFFRNRDFSFWAASKKSQKPGVFSRMPMKKQTLLWSFQFKVSSNYIACDTLHRKYDTLHQKWSKFGYFSNFSESDHSKEQKTYIFRFEGILIDLNKLNPPLKRPLTSIFDQYRWTWGKNKINY